MGFSETDFIGWCVGRGLPVDAGLAVGPGDDAAVLDDGLVLTVDTIVEGVHFERGTRVDAVARKAIGASVSDVCAMGARPAAVLVAAQLPEGVDGRALAEAVAAACARLDVALAGGDTVRAQPGALALSVTAWGRCAGGARVWLRSGAQPGDRLWVSGPLGGSGAGRHLDPRPRVDVVDALRSADVPVHACLDLSDGLGRDLPRLAEASAVGAEIHAARLPIHTDVAADRDPIAAALGDGEDFELLLAIAPDARVPAGLVEIGTVLADPGLRLVRDGRDLAWPRAGYEHAF